MRTVRVFLALCLVASPCAAATVVEVKCAELLQLTDRPGAIAALERVHDDVLDVLHAPPVEVSGVEPLFSRVQLRGASRFVFVDSAELPRLPRARVQEIHRYDRDLWRTLAQPTRSLGPVRALGPVKASREEAAGLLLALVTHASVGSAAVAMAQDRRTYERRMPKLALGLVPALGGAALLVAHYLGGFHVGLGSTLAQVAAGATFAGGFGNALWQLEGASNDLVRQTENDKARADWIFTAARTARSGPVLSEVDARYLSVATADALSHFAREGTSSVPRWIHVAYGDREGLRGRRSAWVDVFFHQLDEAVEVTAFVRP